MNSLKKASLVLTASIVLSGALTACGELESFKPEKKKDIMPEMKLTLPDNVSEALGAVILGAYNADPSVAMGSSTQQEMAIVSDKVDSDKQDSMTSQQQFINLFDLEGQGKIQGISVKKQYVDNTRPDGNGAEKYMVSVDVFARGADLNRKMSFDGQVLADVENATTGFVELSADADTQVSNAAFDKYVDCLPGESEMKAQLKANEAYGIKAFAACFDQMCDRIVVMLQLQNRGDATKDSRVGGLFVDQSSPGKNSDDSEIMNRTEVSLPNVVDATEADYNRSSENIRPECQAQLEATETVQKQGQEQTQNQNQQEAEDAITQKMNTDNFVEQTAEDAITKKMDADNFMGQMDEDAPINITEKTEGLDTEAIDAAVEAALESDQMVGSEEVLNTDDSGAQ